MAINAVATIFKLQADKRRRSAGRLASSNGHATPDAVVFNRFLQLIDKSKIDVLITGT